MGVGAEVGVGGVALGGEEGEVGARGGSARDEVGE